MEGTYTVPLKDILDLEKLSKLSIDDGDQDTTKTLTNLIISAESSVKPQYDLSQIAGYLANANGELVERCLDPLSILSYLLPSPSPGASILLDLMMESCSPKEVIVAAEEYLESIHRAMAQGDDEGSDDEDEWETDDEKKDADEKKRQSKLPVSAQIPRLVRLFSVISKIPFRRKSRKPPSETIRSFIPDLQIAIQICGEKFSKGTGRETIQHSAALAERILDWAESWAQAEQNGPSDEGKKELDEAQKDVQACRAILFPFVSSVIEHLGRYIQAELAKRAFTICFPRLARSGLDPGWEKGVEVAGAVTASFIRIGGTISTSSSNTSSTKTSFILLAHSLFSSPSPLSSNQSPSDPNPKVSVKHNVNVSPHIPVILASIQSNILLDETLAVLLQQFSPSASPIPSDSEIFTPILTIIPSLASFHPDPFTRYCAFRILGLVLDAAPDMLRMQVLRDLVSAKGNGRDKMRVAAVGLVKDALVKALGSSSSTQSMLASPRFLQSFAPILFVPDPPELFDDLDIGGEEDEKLKKKRQAKVLKKLEGEDTQSELARLTECLGLYYVLQRRDERNRTGIRDRDNQANIERKLLEPMRKVLPGLIAWIEQIAGEGAEEIEAGGSSSSAHILREGHSHSHDHSDTQILLMPLIALQVGLERIDEYHPPLNR